MSELKNKAVNGVFWSAIEQFASQGLAFLLGIIIARMIMPSEYGLIAMLGIFMAVAQTFIDSGFSNALVQKHDRSLIDYSTVFYFNIVVSVAVFLALFFCAPYIASYYNQPKLEAVTQIISINLLISAFSVIPRAKLTVSVDFKSQTKASLSATVVSGVVGIVLAYKGFGVWALVVQSLLKNIINTIVLWISARWWPSIVFSRHSFKVLFTFGSKLLISGLLDSVFRNLYLLIIGKKFTATELGYYSRANQFAEFPSSNLSMVIGRVAFPIMCHVQHDNDKLRDIFRKFLKLSVFIIFPLMISLAALSEPLIRFLLTDKWIEAAPLLQALCLSYMFYPVHGLNLTILQAKGRPDLFLRLEFIKKAIGIAVLFGTIPFGIFVMCLGLILTAFLCIFVNVYYTKKILNVGFLAQMGYMMPTLLLSLSMGVGLYLLNLTPLSDSLTLLLGFFCGVVYYYVIAKITKMPELYELQEIVVGYINKSQTH